MFNHQSSPFLLTILLIVTSHSWIGCGSSVEIEKESEVRITNILDSIYHSALNKPMKYLYLNSRRAEVTKELLEGITGEQRTYGRFLLAEEYLSAGKETDAIDILEGLIKEKSHSLDDVDVSNVVFFEKLALCYLRLGEKENCINMHNSESCIIPIQGKGIQRKKKSTETAIDIYESILKKYPANIGVQWLLNIAYMAIGGYPENVPSSYLIPNIDKKDPNELIRFENQAKSWNVDHDGLSGGVCLEDFNNDGHLDIFTTAYGLNSQVRYFESLGKGNGFVDKTREAGLMGQVSGLNTIHADYNNDGFVDILILRGAWLGDYGKHPNSLLKNMGDGSFRDVTQESGLLSFHPTQTGLWFDFNLDGHLDLMIGNESESKWQSIVSRNEPNETSVHRCELFMNNGNGTFSEVSEEVGMNVERFVKSITSGDFNNDGLPDVFFGVMGEENILYINKGEIDGQWIFEDESAKYGIQKPIFAFPSWAWDYNNDGYDDLMVFSFDFRHYGLEHIQQAKEHLGLPLEQEMACLYQNTGNESFRDVTHSAGLNKSFFPMGSNFGDLNNDGFLDFYLGTGAPDFRAILPNRCFLGTETSKFKERTNEYGLGHIQKGHAIAFGDVDLDGDQDIYAVMGGAVEGDNFRNALFINPVKDKKKWIRLKLEGTQANRSALGARIHIITTYQNLEKHIWRTVNTGGSFGASSLTQEIGLGNIDSIDKLYVHWPNLSRAVDSFTNVASNRYYKLVEGKGIFLSTNKNLEP